MKNFCASLVTKVICFILFVFLIVSLIASAVAAYVMIDMGVYFDGGEALTERIYEDYTYKYVSTIDAMVNDSLYGDTSDYYGRRLDPRNTNVRYEVTDGVTVLYGNMTAGEALVHTRTEELRCFVPTDGTINTHYTFLSNYSEMEKYVDDFESFGRKVTSTELSEGANGIISLKLRYYYGEYKDLTVNISVLEQPVKKDILYFYLNAAELAVSMRYAVWVYAFVAFLICIVILVILLCGAGHKRGVEGIYLCKFHKIPLDLYLAVNAFIAFVALEIMMEYAHSDLAWIVMITAGTVLFSSMLLALLMTLSARLKTDNWYKNTVVYFCMKWVFKAVKYIAKGIAFLFVKLPLYYKTALVMAVLLVLEVLFMAMGNEDYVSFRVVETLIVVPFVIYCVICMRALQKSARKMAAGDTDRWTDTRYMIADFKEHGENLNGISNGLALAVEKSVKSERMKAELITNVSHDIKTPLTSIINYVDLLKREGLDGENAPEYLEVLDRQSARLKRLTEDLVEASKASTGNISIELEQTDIGVLLAQAVGEYEERLASCGLTTVLDVAGVELTARADGRRMWRVFDNLLNNICKYAQPDTRVYISAKSDGDKIAVVFRNISREPLNIAPEELTERFVRGDKSRNTEGSGLGLSIAKSLTELQGGAMDITIDGDLFKVTVTI